jgi:hypothetical protein
MDLHEWLDEEAGRAVWLAAQLGCSKAAVSLWRETGVPMARMERIAALTGGAVGVDEMLRHALKCRVEKPAKATEPEQQGAA